MNSSDYWTITNFQKTRNKRLMEISENQKNRTIEVEAEIALATFENVNTDLYLQRRFI